jgi:phosphoglycerol transferase MdoB-like AlkP superfamily enzyme
MNAADTFNTPGAWYIRVLRNPMASIILAILCLVLDFFIGPFIIFPITFMLPVIISAWFCRSYYAYSLAVIQPLIRLGFQFYWPFPWNVTDSIINTVIRIIVFALFAYFVSRTARQTRELAKRVNLLEGILPICSLCKKIRDEHGDWQSVEVYVSNRSEVSFSQSLCPDCLKRDYKNVQSGD